MSHDREHCPICSTIDYDRRVRALRGNAYVSYSSSRALLHAAQGKRRPLELEQAVAKVRARAVALQQVPSS